MEEVEREKDPGREGNKVPWGEKGWAEYLSLFAWAHKFASKMVKKIVDAEIIADQALEAFIRRVEEDRPPKKPYAWVAGTITKKAIKWGAQKKGIRPLSDEWLPKDLSTENAYYYAKNSKEHQKRLNETRAYLDLVLQSLQRTNPLTKAQSQILEGILMGLSHREIARMTGRKPKDVRIIRNQLVNKIKKQIKNGKIHPPPLALLSLWISHFVPLVRMAKP